MKEYLNVKFYSGFKSQEKPSEIEIDGRWIGITGILKEELIEDFITKNRMRLFLVETPLGKMKIIHHLNGDYWENIDVHHGAN